MKIESDALIDEVFAQAFDNRNSITIETDSNLTARGFLGSGTFEDPYRISGFNFTSNETAISVPDISLHLKIIGCSIQSAGLKAGYGIFLENVTEGIIENCTINDKSTGVYIVQSLDCIVNNSYIHDVSSLGIYDDSTRIVIANTIIHDTSSHGIWCIGGNTTINNCDIVQAHENGSREGVIHEWLGLISYAFIDRVVIVDSETKRQPS
jgi:parallel beta-helix repeat protein